MKDMAKSLYDLSSRNTNSSQDASIELALRLISKVRCSKLTPLAINAALITIAMLSTEFDALITAKLEAGEDVN